MKKHKLLFSFTLSIFVLGLSLLVRPHIAAAATITVNSSADTAADDGICTLREAITAANNDTASGATGGECVAGSGTDTIDFAITGAGVHTIAPSLALPDITEPVTIDGYSQNQTGSVATPNTAEAPAPLNGSLKIEINGTNDGGGAILHFTGSSSGSSVRGLVLNRGAGGAIALDSTNLVIAGNYIGTNASGDIDNAITAVQGEGVRISAYTSDDLIGRSEAIPNSAANRIAGNRGAGIAVRSIEYTDYSVTATPTNIAILGNEIYGNVAGGAVTGAIGAGIDIYTATTNNFGATPVDVNATTYTEVGFTANDPADTDTGPNNYINFPVVNSTTQNGTSVSVSFNLEANATDSTPNNSYRVEFFANNTSDGGSQTYLGATTVSDGDNQTANITVANGTDLAGKYITATTTAINTGTSFGFGATSEFSAANNNVMVIAPASSSSELANTGQNMLVILTIAGALVITGAVIIVRNRYHSPKFTSSK